MIRILTADDPGAITITVDGKLERDYIEEIEDCVGKALQRKKQVRLFLRDVSNIDEVGRSLLARLAAQGIELSACGVYSSYVVANLGR